MNALTTQHATDVRTALQTSLYPGASQDSIDMVLSYCKAAQLDPLTKPVHIVPMYDSKARGMRDVIMPGIGLYRTIAARSGCAGISEPEFGPDVNTRLGGVEVTYPAWCKVTVRRQLESGAIVDFTAKELWLENYAVKGGAEKSIAPNNMWAKRPYGQLAKCAEAQALRKGFPEVGAAPTADEMEGKMIETEVVPVAVVHEHPAYPAKDFERNLSAWLTIIDAGKKTADDLIAMIGSKGTLTDAQKARIRSPLNVVDAEIIDGEHA